MNKLVDLQPRIVEKMIEDNFGEELKKSELEAKEAKKIDTVRELLLYLGKKD